MHGSGRILVPLVALVVVSAVGACSNSSGASDRSPPAASGSVNLSRLLLGDKRYVTSGPRKGWVWSCQSRFTGGGAFPDGPWIDGSTWDATAKIAVRGTVRWSSSFRDTLSGSSLVLAGNGLPPHVTGTFPISSSDPAYAYDRNPNS